MSNAPKRPTLADVARLAGVGPATVDRVINERGNVSKDLSERVVRAARELGLKRILPQSHRRTTRIEVILARPELPLIDRMHQEFGRLKATLDKSIVIHRTVLKNEDPNTLAKAMLKTTADAVVVYMREDPVAIDAIARLKARGVPVVALISDIPDSERIAYVGPDHYMSGRSAGYFITSMAQAPGPIIVLCNALTIRSHADRIRGLRDYISEQTEHFELVAIVEGLDDRPRSEAKLRTAFAERPDAVAIYNVGAANLGVAAAIRADVLDHRPIFVGHELTEHSAALLREKIMSLVIDQSPELQARLAVNQILRHFAFADPTSGDDAFDTKPVPIVLYGPENIPEGMFEHKKG